MNPLPDGDGGLPTGAIVGIAVAGAVALLAICAIAAAMVVRRRRLAEGRKASDLRSAASSEASKVSSLMHATCAHVMSCAAVSYTHLTLPTILLV